MPEWIVSLQDRAIKRFAIGEGSRLTIGRSPEADVRIDNAAISRLHAAFSLRNGIYFVEDLNSTNGIFVNGQRTDSEMPVSVEDRIDIGKFRLAPASGMAGQEAGSYATSMDFEDATVFVSSKRQAGSESAPAIQAGRGEHRLRVVSGQAAPAELLLDGKSSIKIGKDPSCDIRLSGWLVAGAQAYVIERDGKFVIVPQPSFSGTSLNGLRIRSEQPLRKGDLIEIRRVKIKYE